MIRLLSFFLIGLPALSMAQSRGFQSPYLLPTASDPAALATADWNKDGSPDLAYIDSASTPSLHVLLGNGNGTFHEVQTLPLPADSCSYLGGTHSCYLQQADVNGDGAADLVFGSTMSSATGYSAVVSVLLGKGDGTFAPAIDSSALLSYSPPSPEGLHMALGDYTGDGKVDVALVDPYDGLLFVMKGDGSGSFTLLNTVQIGNAAGNPYAAYAGDFNQDGKLDVLVFFEAYANTALVFYGDGTGNFSQGPYPSAPGAELNLFLDVTGDGIADLVGHDGNNAYILPGEANGSFLAEQEIAGALVDPAQVVSAADVNGDGIPDLIAQSPTGTSILLGKGNVTYAAPQLATSGAISTALIASADFNGDGVSDLALAGPGGIAFVYGTHSGEFASSGISNAGANVETLFAGDFAGSGRSQVAALQPASSGNGNTVTTMLSSTSGILSAGPTLAIAAASGSGAVADFDGDGRQDIALGGNPVQVLYGNGDGSFTNVQGSFDGGAPFAGYVNKDKLPDLVFETGPFSDISFNTYYELNSLLNSGSRAFTAATTNLPISFFNPQLLAVGDLNGDGLADAVVADNALPGLRVFLGNGDGTFRAGSSLAVTTQQLPSLYGLSASIVDMDQDGHNDLVILSGDLLVFYGDGTGDLSTPQVQPLSRPVASGLQILDINHDGIPDVAVYGPGLIETILNTGKRTFGSESHWLAGQQLNSLVTGDFNGDGYPDLSVADSSSFDATPFLTTLLNIPASTGTTGNPALGTASVSPASVAYNQGFTISSSFAAETNTLPVPTGTAQFSIDGLFLGTAAMSGGGATYAVPGSVTTTLAPGTHSIGVTYSGDAVFASSIATTELMVEQADYVTQTALLLSASSITAGQFVTLTANVTAPVPVVGGIVTFYDGSSILGQVPVASGSAVLQTNLFSLGSNSLTAQFQGFTQLNTLAAQYSMQPSASSALNLTVAAQPTVTTLQSSSASIAAGTVLTLTAKVTSASIPFGAVTFSDGANPIAAMPLDNTGKATYSLVTLTHGTHQLTATYAATDPFAASTSAASTVVVNTVPLSGSLAYISAASGAGGTLQVTGRVLSLDGSLPTGTATLLEDGRIAATGTISSTASSAFNVPAAQAVDHSFYISFSGNTLIAPAASPSLLSTGYGSGPDFTLNVQDPRNGAIASLSGTVLLSAVSSRGWTGTEHLSCASGVPAGYSCSFSNPALQGTGTSLLTFVPAQAFAGKARWLIFAAVTLPFLLRRRPFARIPAMCLLLLLAGCSTSVHREQRAPFVVTVQATAGAVTHSLQLAVE